MRCYRSLTIAVISALGLCAVAECGEAQSSVAPKVLVVDSNLSPSQVEFLNETRPAEVERERVKLKLTAKPFERFTLYYSRQLLCLEDGERQTQLLEECAKLLSENSPILNVADLSAGSQDTLRGMLLGLNSSPAIKTAAMLPSLRLFGADAVTMSVHVGDQSAALFTPPALHYEEYAKAANTISSSDGIAGYLAPMPEIPHRGAPLIGFAFSTGTGTFGSLEFMATARKYLEDEVAAAKRRFESAEEGALKSVYARVAKNFDRLKDLGRQPGFSDLSSDDQSSIRAFFAATHGSGSMDPGPFLSQATTDSFQMSFTLTLLISAGNGGYVTQPIFFESPFSNANP